MNDFSSDSRNPYMWKGFAVFTAMLAVLFLMPPPGLAAEMSDSGIMLAVENELQKDESVPSQLIDVKADDGIVTLSGSVSNLLAKERAGAIAEMVKGVRSVLNIIEVKHSVRTDAEILSDVQTALYEDPATDSFEIDLAIDDGMITLMGTVDSWQEKEICADVAKSVSGVRGIENQIEVEYKEDRPDHEIQAEVERALEMDISVDESLIDVGVKDGRVVLSGTVRSAADRSQAFTDAWVAGVKAVDHSALQVDWRAYEQPQEEQRYVPASNEEIEKAIKEAFLYDPRVNSFALKVDVEKGVATLTGVVDNLKAKEAAEENAMNTSGVQRVKNHVRVRPPNQPPDEEIETKVSLALKRDPFVERHDISPLVTNGMVYLYGTVDSAFERARAEDAAARINGVIAVRNNLTLEAPPEPLPVKSDWEILQDIQNELWWSPFVDADEVEVEVNDGVATLSGTVDSYPERRAAEENAFEGGAISVRNGLEVDYGPPYSFP